MYKLYQSKIHKEDEKTPSSFDNFLCQSPLFDPKDSEEAEKPPAKTKPDQRRARKDEGVWPEYLGSYHMIHRIDGKVFAVGVLDYT